MIDYLQITSMLLKNNKSYSFNNQSFTPPQKKCNLVFTTDKICRGVLPFIIVFSLAVFRIFNLRILKKLLYPFQIGYNDLIHT